jgi:hypothetical protein
LANLARFEPLPAAKSPGRAPFQPAPRSSPHTFIFLLIPLLADRIAARRRRPRPAAFLPAKLAIPILPPRAIGATSVGKSFSQTNGELFESEPSSSFPGRNAMTRRSTCAALAAPLMGTAAFASSAFADNLAMWMRASGANAAAHPVDLWNSTRPDKIELTTIPDTQMVTKLATRVQAKEVPDRVSFVLI